VGTARTVDMADREETADRGETAGKADRVQHMSTRRIHAVPFHVDSTLAANDRAILAHVARNRVVLVHAVRSHDDLGHGDPAHAARNRAVPARVVRSHDDPARDDTAHVVRIRVGPDLFFLRTHALQVPTLPFHWKALRNGLAGPAAQPSSLQLARNIIAASDAENERDCVYS
jgi:hypothetical protein